MNASLRYTAGWRAEEGNASPDRKTHKELVADMSAFAWVFGVIFTIAFLFILGTSGAMAFNFFRLFNRIVKNLDNAAIDPAEAHAEKKRRALEVVAGQPPGSPAHKCRNCGATVDSTAELSADGKVRCNYCNQWSSIYQ